MSLLQFLDQADDSAKNLSQEKRTESIHNPAPALPEGQRDGLLEKSCITGEGALERRAEMSAAKEYIKEFMNELCEIQNKLLMAEKGEHCLFGNRNPEYDDWHDSPDDEIIFEDPEQVLELIGKVCRAVHQCVEYELYQEGYELADRLMSLEILVKGDYSRYGEAALFAKEIRDKGLADFDFRQFILDMLYAAYKSIPLEARGETVYYIICNSDMDDISLETLMGQREAPEDLPEFLEAWIEYLGMQGGKCALRLLTEALILKNDAELSLKSAGRFSRLHPSIYEQILILDLAGEEDEERFAAGQEALEVIRPQYIVRSRIALMTAVYSFRLQKQDEGERCWLEAFRSDTKPIHFLRLLVESLDSSIYMDEAEEIYQPLYETHKANSFSGHPEGELSENRIDRNTFYALSFFDGKFSRVLKEGMNAQGSAGWSSTFMKCGISLFLLYLFEGEELPPGCRYMLDTAGPSISFTTEEYLRGQIRTDNRDSNDLFWDCFCKWKKIMPMPMAEKEQALIKLERWINVRVKGIMDGNRRHHFDECAALIAALDEVKESWGMEKAKVTFMDICRRRYSHRSELIERLEVFGPKEDSCSVS